MLFYIHKLNHNQKGQHHESNNHPSLLAQHVKDYAPLLVLALWSSLVVIVLL
ncbi:hypothetical protein KLEP7_gp90 [Pseudaeromonas phage vB_PpeM_ KLEP7]|nr:hypothetical protein KLEP7_gp90 [Pseudaeromonas phage vB_PpeM_ KLEP7]